MFTYPFEYFAQHFQPTGLDLLSSIKFSFPVKEFVIRYSLLLFVPFAINRELISPFRLFLVIGRFKKLELCSQ
jgi:hypothetical protein